MTGRLVRRIVRQVEPAGDCDEAKAGGGSRSGPVGRRPCRLPAGPGRPRARRRAGAV